MRNHARRYDNVEEGTSCSQTSFKTGGVAFFYIGEQGGRFKAMFKLSNSQSEAEAMAASEPDNFQLGSNSWVTARFSASEPLPITLWKRWLDESYALSQK